MPPKKNLIKKRKRQFFNTQILGDNKIVKVPLNYFTQLPSVAGVTSAKGNIQDYPCSQPVPINVDTWILNAEPPPPPPPHGCANSKEEEVKAWQSIRSNLRTAFYESVMPATSECSDCHSVVSVTVLCVDCTSRPTYCCECAIKSHQENDQFHKMMKFKDGTRSRFNFRRELCAITHSCDRQYMKSMDIFDKHGYNYTCQVTFCRCMTEAECLVRIGYWPSSPKEPVSALSLDLLEWMRAILLETSSSVKSICQSLKVYHGLLDEDVNYLYRTLTRETFEEYRYFHFSVWNTTGRSTAIDDGSSCPACPSEDGAVFVSLDANFGLVRKKNSGKSLEPPKHLSRYFIAQDEVDEFVAAYDANRTPKETNAECNNFQAASAVRAKNKAANLDATGVFGSACRHGIPQIFLSMRHGERYSYPALILKTLLGHTSVHHHIIYDIACKFEGHLKKRTPGLRGYDMALPIFHAYGHKLPCQVLYSTRWKAGYGLTDGECMERLWSYLRKFSHVSKEMTPSHRIDLLSDALFHFASGKIVKIGNALCLSLQKGRDVIRQAQIQIEEICSSQNVTMDTIKKWRQDDVDMLITQGNKSTRQTSSWKEEYVRKLQLQQHLCCEMAVCEDDEQIRLLNTHVRELVAELKTIEEKNAIAVRWTPDSPAYVSVTEGLQRQKKRTLQEKMRCQAVEYNYLKEISRKYSDGQAIAQRVARQRNKASQSLKSSIRAYNEEFLPQQPATFAQIVDPTSEFYHPLQGEQQALATVPDSIRRRAVDALNLLDRGHEEEEIVRAEMGNTVDSFKKQVLSIQDKLDEMDSLLTQEGKGIYCVLREKEAHYIALRDTCSEQFRRAIGGVINIETDEFLLSDNEDDDTNEN